MSAATNVRPFERASEPRPADELQSFWQRWFLPHQGTQVVAQQSSKGLFIPWPLLAILVTLAIVLVTGLVTLEVQVNNLSTTLLLRDNDHARQVDDLKAAQARDTQDLKNQLAKETERRELTDLKMDDVREKLAAAGIKVKTRD